MKRANGTGSIVKLPGNRRKPWAVRVPARNERGRIRQHYLSYHAKAADAQAALDDWCRTHTAPEETAANWTLAQVYAAWSERHYLKISDSAAAVHRFAWRYLQPLADRKMRLITLDQWQSCIDQAVAGGLAPSTSAKIKVLMGVLNKYAMQRDIILKDYSAFVDLPHAQARQKRDGLDDIQLGKLQQLAAAGTPWADTAMILCYTGFRVSELLQLTPTAYHPDGDYLVGGLKTDAGRNRIVPVHPRIKPYLLAWLAKGGQTIICKDDGTPLSDDIYRIRFKAVMQAIGAPDATPHWARYTFASRLHAAGADELAIRRMIGHSDKSITDHYTKLTPDYLRGELIKVS